LLRKSRLLIRRGCDELRFRAAHARDQQIPEMANCLAAEMLQVLPLADQPVYQTERSFGGLCRDRFHQFVEDALGHHAEQFSHLRVYDFIAAVRDRLFKQRKPIAQAAFRRAREHRDELNPLLNIVVPILGILIFIPVLLAAFGIDFGGLGISMRAMLSDPGRPTTVKARLLGSVQSANRATQQLLRVDEEDSLPLASAIERELIARMKRELPRVHGVLISDINKGLLTQNLLRATIDGARKRKIPVIVDPRGTIVAGPLHEEHGILYAECDPLIASAAKRTLDVAGHYGRPDIFKLEVNREVLTPIDFG